MLTTVYIRVRSTESAHSADVDTQIVKVDLK
uniref:Uncharacterized protein n=1 Tax=Anguilla anguilla TaxID=7936 RepID=A0A0E9V4D8_ANGAN